MKATLENYFNEHGPFKMHLLLRAQFHKSVSVGGETIIEELSQAPYFKTTPQLMENLSNVDNSLDYMLSNLFQKLATFQYERSGKILKEMVLLLLLF